MPSGFRLRLIPLSSRDAMLPTATTPTAAASPPVVSDGFEYLLLGDLRMILLEAGRPESGRWLLAILDRLLAGELRSSQLAVAVSVDRRGVWMSSPIPANPMAFLFAKLQRLRDRVALRAPYTLLAEEILADLHDVLDVQVTVAA